MDAEYIPHPSESNTPEPVKASDGRAMIQMPGDGRLLSDFAFDLGKILSRADLFSRGGLVFTVNESGTGLRQVTPDYLRTWVEQFLVCYRRIKSENGQPEWKLKKTMLATDAAGVLQASQFVGQLNKVERFNTIRMPAFNEQGYLRLLEPGYDEFTRTFTADNNVPILDCVPLEICRQTIDDLLAEFPFQGTQSKAVAVASMLTVFAQGMLPKKSLRPCFIFLANSEGAGKTLLTKCATVPVLGHSPTGSKPSDDTEMRKVLLTAVMEAKGVLVFDNVRGRLASDALEGFLTSQDWSDRILGGSQTFSGENNVTVFVTGNGATVSPDMRRRSLFCELFIEAERSEDRIFKNSLEVPELIERRGEILSALYGMILDWHKAMEPKPSRGHASFSDWARIIGGIVEHAGYGCPHAAAEIDGAADVDGADMRTLVTSLGIGKLEAVFKFDELVDESREHGLFERILPEHGDLDIKARSSFACLLKTYDRRIIGGYRFACEGKGRKRQFRVQKEQVR